MTECPPRHRTAMHRAHAAAGRTAPATKPILTVGSAGWHTTVPVAVGALVTPGCRPRSRNPEPEGRRYATS